MATANHQFERLQALKLNKKVVTSTYTVKTGRSTDGFIIDNPVDIDVSAASFTLTVPDGEVMGQTLLIVMSDANSNECTVDVLHHLTASPEDRFLNADNESLFMLWNGAVWIPVYDTGSDNTAG